MPFRAACPNCNTEFECEEAHIGAEAECGECSHAFTIQRPKAKAVPVPPAPTASSGRKRVKAPAAAVSAQSARSQKPGEPQKVIVTNIKMSFGAMVVFMIKWVLAAIPAFIILALIFGILSLIFGAIVTGCVTGMRST
jgi:predicted Zn finger-like uncharacterized protein